MKAALLLFLIPLALAAEPIPAGKSKLALEVNGAALDVFTFRPESYRDGPLLVVMHGLNRNADDYRDSAVPLAEQLKALVVAPHFPKDRFSTDAYQRGGVMRDKEAQPREKWTFQYVIDLIRLMRESEGRPDMPCYLIGHSAGGQILHRMACFMPGDAVRIIAANPGTLLFPTREEKFPFGFGGLPAELSSDDQIRAYLAAPLTLYLGTADLLEKNLDMSESALRQGKTRFERGHACFTMAQKLAAERGWPFHWELIEAPGIGHTAAGMFGHAQAVKAFTQTKP
jgi:pimeloyl-ACP methyl ester carboxylesterase